MAQCMRVEKSEIFGEEGKFFDRQCPNPGEWHPVVVFHGTQGELARFVSPIVVCKDHKDPDPSAFVTDETWEAFSSKIQEAGAEAVRSKTRLEYLSVQDKLAREMHALINEQAGRS